MPTRDRHASRGRQRAARFYLDVGAEFRNARLASGLTQARVARVIGVSQMQVSRIERARCRVDLGVLSAFAAVVGQDLSVRVFPAGPPIRDAGHVRLMGRLRGATPLIRWRAEVPLPIPGDQRAMDAVGECSDGRVAAELEMRLVDAQALVRRATLKAKEAGIERMLLVLPATKLNRSAVEGASPTLTASFPLGSREVLAAMRSGRMPPASGILFL